MTDKRVWVSWSHGWKGGSKVINVSQDLYIQRWLDSLYYASSKSRTAILAWTEESGGKPPLRQIPLFNLTEDNRQAWCNKLKKMTGPGSLSGEEGPASSEVVCLDDLRPWTDSPFNRCWKRQSLVLDVRKIERCKREQIAARKMATVRDQLPSPLIWRALIGWTLLLYCKNLMELLVQSLGWLEFVLALQS